MDSTPRTAREIIMNLPQRFKPQVAENTEANVHLVISGDEGGEFTVKIDDGQCVVSEGLIGEPDCVVRASDQTYAALELGEINPQMAVFSGKVKVSNIPVLLQFIQMFKRLH